LIIATKKYDILKNRNVDKDVIKRKLITFLSSRGYKYDVIKEVCDELIIEGNDLDWHNFLFQFWWTLTKIYMLKNYFELIHKVL